MKKNILILSLLLSSSAATYAFNQQSVTAYANTPNQYAQMGVNINSNCTYLLFNCEWSNATSGTATAFGDTLLGEYSWSAGSGQSNYSVLGSGKYWSSLTVYIYAGGPLGAQGTATVSWF